MNRPGACKESLLCDSFSPVSLTSCSLPLERRSLSMLQQRRNPFFQQVKKPEAGDQEEMPGVGSPGRYRECDKLKELGTKKIISLVTGFYVKQR